MEYSELIELIPREKRERTADKLINIILSSKNDTKMPSNIASTILHQWQQNLLLNESGLSTLLKAAVLLEQEKTLTTLKELQLNELALKIKGGV
ncbi:MAG: hypothetical protein PVF15_10510 [Candidatus Bathyarchaeota archaeon]|jgi:hypothetical protein